jgi:hypothetical protein
MAPVAAVWVPVGSMFIAVFDGLLPVAGQRSGLSGQLMIMVNEPLT